MLRLLLLILVIPLNLIQSHLLLLPIPGQVLLCTAEVDLIDTNTNETYLVKALLDIGSQSSFICVKVLRKIDLLCSSTDPIVISGINNSVTKTTKICNVKLRSRVNSFTTNVSCLVIPEITGQLPSAQVNTSQLNLPVSIKLANPSFYRPSDIHILLGADVFWELIGFNQIKLGKNKPILHE